MQICEHDIENRAKRLLLTYHYLFIQKISIVFCSNADLQLKIH